MPKIRVDWAWQRSLRLIESAAPFALAAGLLLLSLVVMSKTAGQTSPQPFQPAPGLVAAYGFEEGSGTTVGDSSGNGLTGLISGATWTAAGRYGNALVFNGTSDWVTIADTSALDLSSSLTLMAWIFPTTASGVRDIIVKEGSSVDIYNLYARNWRGRPESNVFVGGNQTAEGAVLPANVWIHVAGTYDGATLRLFINGTEVASAAVSGPVGISTGPLRIGGNSMWGEFFEGRIDEVRVYDRALSQTEIQTDMTTAIGPAPPPPPPPPLSQVGQWSGPFDWPIVAVHMALLRTGEVLAWDGGGAGREVRLWNPTTNAFTDVSSNISNLFCSGHAALSDGRLFVAGGHADTHVGIPDVNLFDPGPGWLPAPAMSVGRWYPTVTTLPDGRVLVVSGDTTCFRCTADIPEIYDPATNTWIQLTNARLVIPLYPHMFVLPDGRVLSAGSAGGDIDSRVLEIATQAWATVDPVAVDGGSSAMYLPGKVIKSGSSGNVDPAFKIAVANTYVLDTTQSSPAWRATAPMAFPRTQHNLTLLPDGTILVTGGGRNTDVFDLASAVHEAELWSPTTETWTTMGRMVVPRLYHSTALLLPDGRVLVAGGGRSGVDQFSAEIYSPPYLYKGTRPSITSVPTTLQYGTDFILQTADAPRIAMVSLVRPGSVTHAFNQDQRFIPLTFQQISGGLHVQPPANANLAPPGYYMLFLVDTEGVPSLASFVRFPSPAENVRPPTAVIQATPTSGPAPLTVNFDGSGSSDPDPGDTIVSYAWDLDGDGQFDDASTPQVTFTYAASGSYSVRLQVVDNRGETGTSVPTVITVGPPNNPPTATIESPVATLTWQVGDVISFSGHATDPEDGNLPASRLAWSIILHHCPTNCHTHPLQDFTGVATGSFSAPDHEYPSHLEVKLTATDSGGRTDTKSVLLDPKPVALSFQSSPSGLQLVVGSSSSATPFSRTVILGSNNSISAPSPQSLGGTTYLFASWSDGGAQTHNITAAATATYTATYTAQTTVTAFPTGTVIETGSLQSGSAASLNADDNIYYVVSSTTSGTRTTSWYGSFTGVPNSLSNLKITYKGKNSRNCTQTVAIWRWTDSTWVQLDSRSVSTTEIEIANLIPPGVQGDYVSGTSGNGEHRVRVRCTRNSQSFSSSGDLMKIVYDTASPPPGPVGLVSAYGFNEGTGTTAADASGNGHTGTLVNGTAWAAGKLGSAVSLDGVNDYVSVANPNLPTGDYTWEAWVNPNQTSTFQGLMVSRGLGVSPGGLEFGIDSGGKIIVWSNGVLRLTSATTIPAGVWTHLALTREGGTLKLYVNGTPDPNTGTDGVAHDFSTCPLLVGVDNDSGCTGDLNGYFVGRVDEIRVYDRALTLGEIQTDMATPIQP